MICFQHLRWGRGERKPIMACKTTMGMQDDHIVQVICCRTPPPLARPLQRVSAERGLVTREKYDRVQHIAAARVLCVWVMARVWVGVAESRSYSSRD